ncbi:MAG: adenosylcobinamide-GDP ribazoletransferase [Pseudomonadota bacterium]
MSPWRREIGLMALAATFLTRLPLRDPDPFTPARMAASARYFPLIGGLVGLIGAGLFLAASLLWTPPVAALLALAGILLVTGALHEDGLADTADGLGGGATRDRALEIMRDSRIGAYGTLALIVSVGLRVAALAALSPMLAAAALIAGHAASRAASVAVMATSSYARETGAGGFGREGLPGATLPVALGLAAACALPLAWLDGPAVLTGLAAAAVATLAFRRWSVRRLGGHTGDTLGAAEQLAQSAFLLALAAWS